MLEVGRLSVFNVVRPFFSTSFVLQILYQSNLGTSSGSLGRMAQSAAIIDRLDDGYANTIKLVSGVAPTRESVSYLNAIGTDAVVVSAREFSQGPAALAAVVAGNATDPGARFPLLSANFDFSADPDVGGLVTAGGQDAASIRGQIASSAVLTLSGQRVGLVGLTTPALPLSGGIVGRTPAVTDLDALAAVAQAAIDPLRSQGINKIILSAQIGEGQNLFDFVNKLSGVDIVILTGSTTLTADRTYYPSDHDGYPVLLVQTPGQYDSVGRIVVDFNDAGYADVSRSSVSSLPVDDATVSALWGAADPYALGSRASRVLGQSQITDGSPDGNVLGYTNVFLNGSAADVRTQETNLGNLSADANLYLARGPRTFFAPSVLVAITDAGGFGGSIGSASGGPPEGNQASGRLSGGISQLAIEAALPGNRNLTLLRVSAANLVRIMEHAVASVAPGATPSSFPQISGFTFSFDPTRQAQVADAAGTVTTPGERIRNLVILNADEGVRDVIVHDGTVLGDPQRSIGVVVPDSLANGGNGYRFDLYATSQGEELQNSAGLLDGATSFAGKGSERDALAEYLRDLAPTTATALTGADFGMDRDSRIQNLSARGDSVLSRVTGARALGASALSSTAASIVARVLEGASGSRQPALVISDFSGDGSALVPGYSNVLLRSPTGIYQSYPATLPAGYDGIILKGAYGQAIRTSSDNVLLVGDAGSSEFISLGANSTLVAGSGSTSMLATGGGNTVVGGAGNDSMAGGGTFFTGGGRNLVSLNETGSVVRAEGQDTVFTGLAGPANDTIGAAEGSNGTVVFAGAGRLTFVNASAASTVTGGAGGSATIFGGTGGGIFQGGTGGDNVLIGQVGTVTLVGGGDGDLLYAEGYGQNLLVAGPGNSTLVGGAYSSSDNVFIGAFGTAAATVQGGNGADIVFAGTGRLVADGGAGVDLFVFTADRPGGTTVINAFDTNQDRLALLGHDPGEAARALATAQVANGSTTLTLIDDTRVTFTGVANLNSSVFI